MMSVRTWKEAFIAYFKRLSHLHGGTGNDEKPQSM
jgi:hypothetical protein